MNEVVAASQGSTALVNAEDLNFLSQDAGLGTENLTTRDLSIPFISILQTNSPQVSKKDGEYIPGAEAGMFLNSALNTVYDGDEGICLVPVHYELRAAEWRPRKSGGGLVKDFGTDVSVAESLITSKDPVTNKSLTQAGTEIVIAGTHYVLLCMNGTYVPAVVVLSATQLKKSRRWNGLMSSLTLSKDGKTFRPASFAMSYLATTVSESNEKGSWYGWKIVTNLWLINPTPGGKSFPNGLEVYKAAKDFRQAILEGSVRAKPVENEPSDTSLPF